MRTAYLVAPEADAADAVQDGFLKAYAALARFRAGAPFRPWLLRIVANEARNRRRSADRRTGLALRASGRGAGRRGRPTRRRRSTSPARRAGSSAPRSACCATRTAR